MKIHKFRGIPRQQEGAVLFVALMLLIVLTMVGISAIESTKLETRMAANLREYNHALQAAEIGLATARNLLEKDIQKISDIYEKGIPLSTTLDNIKRDNESGRYQITYTIVAAEGNYNNTAIFKTKASEINSSTETGSISNSGTSGSYAKFLVTVTGRSTTQDNAAEVVLKGGLQKLIPR